MSVLKVKPKSKIDIAIGEEISYTLNCTKELDDNTVKDKTMSIADSNGADVTSNFSGGISESSGVITFGIKGYATGTYTITFIVTCNEMLPDGITYEEFIVSMMLTVK